MENVTRTVYGAQLQTNQFGNSEFQMLDNTTLNEKFNIQAGVEPANTPAVGYYAIGNGGHTTAMGAGNIPLIRSVEHLATDAALYNHLPFVLRTVDNDLTQAERTKYALRKQITVDSTPYIAYYLKRIDVASGIPQLKLQTTNNGVTSTSTFVPSATNLSPTPPALSESNVNTLKSQYAIVSQPIPFSLTAAEVAEILNAAAIIYGDEAYAVISEMSLCSGEDKAITLAGGDVFNEAVAVQCCSFISTFHMLAASRTGITGTLELGSAEPLLTVSTGTVATSLPQI